MMQKRLTHSVSSLFLLFKAVQQAEEAKRVNNDYQYVCLGLVTSALTILHQYRATAWIIRFSGTDICHRESIRCPTTSVCCSLHNHRDLVWWFVPSDKGEDDVDQLVFKCINPPHLYSHLYWKISGRDFAEQSIFGAAVEGRSHHHARRFSLRLVPQKKTWWPN